MATWQQWRKLEPFSWTQHVSWTCKRPSQDIQDVFWTCYIRLIYVLCPVGNLFPKEILNKTLFFRDKDCPTNISLFKVTNRNTRNESGICSKLTIKTPKRRHWRRSGIFIVNSEYISYFFPVLLLLTLNKQILAGGYQFINHVVKL